MKEHFGQFVREKRKSKNIKLKDFAEMIGISSVYASYIETGKRPAPSREKCDAIADVLSLTADETDHMRRLASCSRHERQLPDDLNDYLTEAPYIIDAIRISMENEATSQDWMEIINKLNNIQHRQHLTGS